MPVGHAPLHEVRDPAPLTDAPAPQPRTDTPPDPAAHGVLATVPAWLRGVPAWLEIAGLEQREAEGMVALGPAPASVVKVNNRYRYRITVVGKCTAPVRRLLAAYMKEFARRKENRTLHIFAECNRMN